MNSTQGEEIEIAAIRPTDKNEWIQRKTKETQRTRNKKKELVPSDRRFQDIANNLNTKTRKMKPFWTISHEILERDCLESFFSLSLSHHPKKITQKRIILNKTIQQGTTYGKRLHSSGQRKYLPLVENGATCGTVGGQQISNNHALNVFIDENIVNALNYCGATSNCIFHEETLPNDKTTISCAISSPPSQTEIFHYNVSHTQQ
ncbi:hypothetical protein RFI_24089 [Reticulomyxa filosa]|uniref:Uncharacterized protein n=1 Tax=Reticulomyxa filosa TaxID=46433 RepID=X6MI03_RETFI|nr:hypothetical protein RFI_24089 [Reticulomyxa filosa]|eukprot:ETO13286.1 hypothetical protein RFI_24089 [Reticulomyxa filosa]